MSIETSYLHASEQLPLVIAVDLGGTQIRAAVLRGATLLSRVNTLTGENPSPERVIPRMIDAIREAVSDAQVTLDDIAGIGVGAPGPLNGHAGIVFCPPNLPGWKDVPLRDIFYEQLQVPVFLDNDANAAALGEYLFGAGRGSQEVVYITISTGIGGGVITNGQLAAGIMGTAGEIGHMTVDMRGPRCNCGNIGCLESLASGTAIARRANERIALGQKDGAELLAFALQNTPDQSANTPHDSKKSLKTPIHLNARMVAQAAEAGIPLAKQIIAGAAEALGVGLVNIIHLFNPEVIILGGGVVQMGDRLLGPAQRLVKERAMRVPRESARIVLAELGSDVGLIGAGALVYYHKQ